MKWLFLVTFTLLAVGVFSAAFNNEEDVPIKELMEDANNEGEDETEKDQGGARFVRAVKEDEKDGGVPAMAKSSLTENDEYEENDENDEYDENDNTQNDEPEGNFAEMDENEAPIDTKAAFDEEEDMTNANENPEQ